MQDLLDAVPADRMVACLSTHEAIILHDGEKEQHHRAAETSPFITCGHCTMEFRKTDLPPGGKCPVCGRPLNVDAD